VGVHHLDVSGLRLARDGFQRRLPSSGRGLEAGVEVDAAVGARLRDWDVVGGAVYFQERHDARVALRFGGL
jgi:hypothetical protein